jgi:hypothetical protein
MPDLKVPDSLWASTILPEGVLGRWLVSDGAAVCKGDPIATIRIEEALHEVTAPAHGRLPIIIGGNDVIEPGIRAPADPSLCPASAPAGLLTCAYPLDGVAQAVRLPGCETTGAQIGTSVLRGLW